jgi:N-methylhydantoinase A
VRASLCQEGFAPAEQRIERAADLRYDGQAFEVRAEAPGSGAGGTGFLDGVVGAFHDAHEALYGYCYRDRPDHGVEWVNLRVTGVGPIARPAIGLAEAGGGDPSAARHGNRRVYVAGEWYDTALYDRSRLRAGDAVSGPAVIEEFGSTVPVLPGFRATVDPRANLLLVQEER